MPLPPVVNVKPLANRDRRFLALYFANGMNATDAWFKLCEQAGKPCSRESAEVQGSRALKRCRLSGDLNAMLEERGLDDMRIVCELDRLLSVQRLAFSPDGKAHKFDDGPTQVKALEMLKDLRGHNSVQEINVNGAISVGVLRAPKQLTAEEWAARAIAYQSALMADAPHD